MFVLIETDFLLQFPLRSHISQLISIFLSLATIMNIIRIPASFCNTSVSWWSFTGVQMTASLQDYSQYSHLLQLYHCLYDADSSSGFFSLNPLSQLLWNVPNAPSLTGITFTLLFHCFLSSLATSKYFSIVLISLILILWKIRSIARCFFFFFFVNYH